MKKILTLQRGQQKPFVFNKKSEKNNFDENFLKKVGEVENKKQHKSSRSYFTVINIILHIFP